MESILCWGLRTLPLEVHKKKYKKKKNSNDAISLMVMSAPHAVSGTEE